MNKQRPVLVGIPETFIDPGSTATIHIQPHMPITISRLLLTHSCACFVDVVYVQMSNISSLITEKPIPGELFCHPRLDLDAITEQLPELDLAHIGAFLPGKLTPANTCTLRIRARKENQHTVLVRGALYGEVPPWT